MVACTDKCRGEDILRSIVERKMKSAILKVGWRRMEGWRGIQMRGCDQSLNIVSTKAVRPLGRLAVGPDHNAWR